MNLNILSEYGKLKVVMVHRPGREIERLTKENFQEFLFEDIPYLKEMQNEHDNFVQHLKSKGVTVLYFKDILLDILKIPKVKKQIVQKAVSLEYCGGSETDLLKLDPEVLCEDLIAGITINEARERKFNGLKNSKELPEGFLLKPIPNLYFMRDPGVVIGNGVVASNMHYSIRIRESLLLEFIFNFHDNFKGNFFPIFGFEKLEQRPFNVEGGDVIVLNETSVAIGCSERTRSESIHKIAQSLFSMPGSKFEKVFEVTIPMRREYMHLDTVFTVVGPKKVVIYPEALKLALETKIYTKEINKGQIRAAPQVEPEPFLEILDNVLGGLTPIKTGGGNPFAASREQRADGTNVLAIGPDLAVTYNRNIKTNEELEKFNVDYHGIPGSELVRGLGGPRCMTMPLVRE